MTDWSASLGSSGEGYLHCPHCGFEYNHITGFGLEYYSHDYDAPKGKVYFDSAFVQRALEEIRCAALRVDLQREDGHQWSLFLHQSHGALYLHASCPRITG